MAVGLHFPVPVKLNYYLRQRVQVTDSVPVKSELKTGYVLN